METKKFKPFDKVLVKDGYGVWGCDLYSHWDKNKKSHCTVGFWCCVNISDEEILSFEEYSHLLGTFDSPDKEVRLEEGEYLVCFDCMDYFEAKDFCLSPFNALRESTVRTKDGNNWSLFIRFSDFNPNDMEAMKAKILCVKGGKIVKYKG